MILETMSWKSWGDHPLVVLIGVVAGLSAVAGLAYTVGVNSSTVSSVQPEDVYSETDNSAAQDSTVNSIDGDNNSISSNSNNDSSTTVSSEGDNSPSINNSNGDVNVNYNALEKEIPEFVGEIKNGSIGEDFVGFMKENDNRVVYIDAYISDHRAEDRRDRVYVCHKDSVNAECQESDFTVFYSCEDPDPGGVQPPCLGMTYTIKMPEISNNIFGWATGVYNIKGYWIPQYTPNLMISGLMYSTLTAVKPEDAR